MDFKSLALVALVSAQALTSQTDIVATHSAAELDRQEKELRAKAATSADGSAVAKIDDYPGHSLLMVVRAKTGDAELHKLWVDEAFIRAGDVTLVVGGALTGEHASKGDANELRGNAIEGGKSQILHPGDIVHIPSNLPHWFKVSPGAVCVYFVTKTK